MPSPESSQPPIIEMAFGAKSGKNPEKARAEKTQTELREALEKRFGTLTADAQVNINNYKQMLEDGTFEDKDGEEAGSGDKRREIAEAKIEDTMNRAEKMKKTLDSKEELPQSAPQIEAQYAPIDAKTGKRGSPETIILDIEKKTQEFLDFYKKTNVDVPSDFKEAIQDIWERDGKEIQEAIEQNGFDEVLIVPASLDIGDLSKKMTMKNGYYDWIKSSGNVKSLDGIPFTNSNVDKPRIILVHKDRAQNLKDRPELAQTLNVKGQDVKLDQTLTLEDYLVFQKKYFDETGKHLDEDGWTWLSTKSGARLVHSHWNFGDGKLYVHADGLGYQNGTLGARPSRSFF
ncbi:MAG: hypothetical protein WCO48_03205 [Candidatus Taylorbacteria bacterium]